VIHLNHYLIETKPAALVWLDLEILNSNQANNRNGNNSSHQNNKAHKEAMILRWTPTTDIPF
ncbi:hypothetical protein, partial [Escherichia coli]|uniref:hypothetical protein n=1 Tax=Escherichia coli TaxID=562 RepID=UPI0019205B52